MELARMPEDQSQSIPCYSWNCVSINNPPVYSSLSAESCKVRPLLPCRPLLGDPQGSREVESRNPELRLRPRAMDEVGAIANLNTSYRFIHCTRCACELSHRGWRELLTASAVEPYGRQNLDL